MRFRRRRWKRSLKQEPLSHSQARGEIYVAEQRGVVRKVLLADYGHQCFYCGTGLTINTCLIRHHIPRAQGGSNLFDNLRPACAKCCDTQINHRKYQGLVL
jgi:5-methylcytosine-specific restriction endonuclease McrA